MNIKVNTNLPITASPTTPITKFAIAAAVILVLFAVPFFVSGYRSFQIAQIMIYAIALLGLNLLTGYNGQLSLGHGAFFAIGGYATAVFITQFVIPYWAVIPVAAVIGFIVGFLFGFPALRLGALYLALATFSLALAVPQLLKYKKIAHITGGVMGIMLQKPAVPAWLPINQDQWLYIFTLLITLIMFLLVRNLLKSRMGRAIIAIRESEVAAKSSGINVALVKSVTFGISVMYTCVAGALSTILISFVNPDSFPLMLSISLLTGVIVGGLASIPGAIYGAIFISLIPNLADYLSKSAPGAVYGACLMASVYFMPKGIHGLFRKIYDKLLRRKEVID